MSIDLHTLLHHRPANAHKGMMGHALLVAGRSDVAGCAMLASEAALRSGCGKLTVHTSAANRIPLHVAVPEAILCTDEGPCVTRVAGRLSQFQALGIGPGIGYECASVVEDYLRQTSCPVVIDADALHLLAQHPRWLPLLKGRAVLTPHLGEARALAEGLYAGRFSTPEEAMRQLPVEWDTVVVMKPSTLLLPHSEAETCPYGNPGMATAGSGDVLTGLLTGFLAQGYSTHDAARLGVWLHALAGDAAAKELGEECLLARDIVRHLPQAFRSHLPEEGR